jgi:hypothetical protein
MITGRCDCGRVRYQADADIEDFSHCHCSICRRVHGAAFVSWGGVPKASFRYLSGESGVRVYDATGGIERYFCGTCGSSFLAWMKAEADQVYLAMGTVDGDPDRPAGYHFFVDSKVPWIDLGDGLPQWDRWPPGDEPWRD